MSSSVAHCAAKSSRRADVSALPRRRKGAREKLYGIIGTQPAFPRAREVCFADSCYDARGSRTYCACQSASRVSYGPENAGESCDERFPPFRNRANAHEAFSSRSFPIYGLPACRLPGVDLPRGMDGVVRDAILEPLGYRHTYDHVEGNIFSRE